MRNQTDYWKEHIQQKNINYPNIFTKIDNFPCYIHINQIFPSLQSHKRTKQTVFWALRYFLIPVADASLCCIYF